MDPRGGLSSLVAALILLAGGGGLISGLRMSSAQHGTSVRGASFASRGDRFTFLVDSLGRPDSLGRREPGRRDSTFRDSTRSDTAWRDSTRRDSTHRPPQPKPSRPKPHEGPLKPNPGTPKLRG
jgi:hypothetical protein